jgi:hypothetical protein
MGFAAQQHHVTAQDAYKVIWTSIRKIKFWLRIVDGRVTVAGMGKKTQSTKRDG